MKEQSILFSPWSLQSPDPYKVEFEVLTDDLVVDLPMPGVETPAFEVSSVATFGLGVPSLGSLGVEGFGWRGLGFWVRGFRGVGVLGIADLRFGDVLWSWAEQCIGSQRYNLGQPGMRLPLCGQLFPGAPA